MKIEPLYPPFYKRIDNKLWLVWSFALLALIFSLVQEFYLSIKPCFLCQLQRIPFIIMTFLPMGLLFLSQNFIKKAFIFCLTFSWLIATFHFLIQMKVLPDNCSVPNVSTIQDFQKILENPISCAKIPWTFLWLPISAYNAILSFFLTFILIQKKSHIFNDLLLTNLFFLSLYLL